MRASIFTLLVLLVGCSELAGAQERARRDPFAAIESGDPMELARLVDRHGDDAVLERLDEGRPRDVRLAAVRAARFMRWPELALEPLAELAAGRDPLLAPAAARAVLAIATELRLDDLARREVELESLAPARAALSRLAADESARPDIRAAADRALASLDALAPR